MNYRLLDEFRKLFQGQRYRHRDSSLGDWVARHLYEDLYSSGKSKIFRERVDAHEHVLNLQNKRQGIQARRGDGMFGELVPGVAVVVEPGFQVARGPIATVEIGIETKILAKAMIKQIDRVKRDLKDQVSEFQRGLTGMAPICVGIVGINHASYTVGWEGERPFRTDGKQNKHPAQEAAAAEAHLVADAKPKFDEFLILRYRATNEDPYPFDWADQVTTTRDYGAMLTRIARAYDVRFGS